MDGSGHELWRKTFSEPLFEPSYNVKSAGRARKPVQFADIDDDGAVEVLFTYYHGRREAESQPLICYSDRGVEKWRFQTDKVVADRSRTYVPIFGVDRVQVVDLGRAGRRVLAVTNHEYSHPSRLTLLDGKGRVTGEYWHSGHIVRVATMDLDDDGEPEILAEAISNHDGLVSLIVLDPRDLRGCSKLPEGAGTQLQGCAEAHEKARILFPRTCASRTEAHTWGEGLAIEGEHIVVRVRHQTGAMMSEIIHKLDRRLDLVDCIWSPYMRTLHREMEVKGLVNHLLTAEEERLGCTPIVWKALQ